MTELISSHALVYLAKNPERRFKRLGRQTLFLMERFPSETPFAVQIFGSDSDQMAEAARIVEGQGADIVDLNFGCPARKVVKGGWGAGVALMRDPPRLEDIARRVVDAVSIPVTAKIRAGWSPSTRNAPEVAKRLEQAGIQALCIHGRTGDQVHSGPVDFDSIAAVCAAVSIPVTGNGGVRSRADLENMTARTGCARVAIGQAAKGNPWIFSEVLGDEPGTGSTLEERIEMCRRHFYFYVKWTRDERRAVLEMRKHGCWYLKGFEGAAALRKHLTEAVDHDSFLRVLDSAFCN